MVLIRLFLGIALLSFLSCNPSNGQKMNSEEKGETSKIEIGSINKVKKSEEEWKSELTEMEYYVLRQKGTERAYTGDLLKNKDKGVYTCAGCGLSLFQSETKYNSGCGWPSFYQPVDKKVIKEKADNTLNMQRTELLCARCGGHLGHVFNDGPKPTGLRYCINSASLDFEKEEE